MKYLFSSVLFFGSLLLALPALAIVEFSIGGQGLMSSSGGGNWTGDSSTSYSFSGGSGLEAEIRFNLPFGDLQLGARYGQIGVTASSGASSLAMNATTYSGLVAYRLINTGILFGPVFTYALSGSGTLQNSLATTGGAAATAGSVGQYTAGLELGIKIPFLLAVEAGIGDLTMNSFSGNQLLGGSSTNVSLSGTYVRAGAGFSF